MNCVQVAPPKVKLNILCIERGEILIKKVGGIMKDICDKKDEVADRLNEHEIRIRELEIKEARTSERIEGLIDKLDNLTNWIKALIMLGLTSLIGFLVWYIQNLKS